jgi:segregation and condensation protein B
MDKSEQKRIVEALLFAADFPVAGSRIKALVEGLEREELKELVGKLNREYEEQGRSFWIQEVAGGYQMATRPHYARWVRELYRGRRLAKLTQPGLETLAIIAYRQPVGRPDIETIRGVNSDSVIATLLERNLITVVGKDTKVGRPILYGTTPEFLRYFGLKDLTGLPALSELEAYLVSREQAAEGEQVQEEEPDKPGSSEEGV